MIESPLSLDTAFTLGPVRVTVPVVVTWGLMGALTLASFLITRRLRIRPGRGQAALELVVSAIEGQIRDTMGVAPRPYLPLIGTLFLFILEANWSSLIPGLEPPTGRIETDAALALIVFFAVIWFGIRARGVIGYLKTFAEPTFIMIPLNRVETFTRTFSLIVRLFGNVMSGAFIIAIILSLAGLIVPIPFMGIELLIGAIQAYIFTVLAMVFIGSAINEGRPQESGHESGEQSGEASGKASKERTVA
jgi:F-type H+-transporting ATPase subunit a